MDYFGINSAEELPKINEVLAETMISPTLVNAEHFEMEGSTEEIQTDETSEVPEQTTDNEENENS
jgi:segregation and condensation protein B